MMNRLLVVRNRQGRFFVRRVLIGVCALWLSASVAALAQSTAPALKATQPFSIRATHVAGLPNTKNNCKGTLSAQDNVLRFEQSGKTVAQVDIASVRKAFLGEESMQVGGLPMKIGKAAAPYGGGRLVSLFAHKKYDTLTLEYVDGDGGVHGAIFQIDKGQGELVRNELVARGVSSSSGENQATKQSTSEVTHDDK
jgi:hypothetical protein